MGGPFGILGLLQINRPRTVPTKNSPQPVACTVSWEDTLSPNTWQGVSLQGHQHSPPQATGQFLTGGGPTCWEPPIFLAPPSGHYSSRAHCLPSYRAQWGLRGRDSHQINLWLWAPGQRPMWEGQRGTLSVSIASSFDTECPGTRGLGELNGYKGRGALRATGGVTLLQGFIPRE